MHSYILKPNIPFLSEMNAESTAVLQDMISETIPEIQREVVTTPPWYNMSQKYPGSLRVKVNRSKGSTDIEQDPKTEE